MPLIYFSNNSIRNTGLEMLKVEVWIEVQEKKNN